MPIYDDIREKIKKNGGGNGTVGAFNSNGGEQMKITYTTPDGSEDHLVVPYLIGTSPHPTTGTDVPRLAAFKYQGTTAHPGTGWRCYDVGKITAVANTSPPITSLPKLKLKRQNCVDTW
jgi:hypothetical protein